MNELKTDLFFIENFIEENAEAIFVLDAAYRIIFWNRNCEKLLDCCKKNVIGKSIDHAIPEFAGDSFKSRVRRAIAREPSLSDDFFLVMNGNNRYLAPSFSPLPLPDAGVACLVILRKAERPQMTKLEALLEQSPNATAIFRLDGTVKYMNKAYGSLWGAKTSTVESFIRDYNIFKDGHVDELGLLPLVKRAFSGETVEIPPVAYNPYQFSSLDVNSTEEKIIVKGYLFSQKTQAGSAEEAVMMLSDVTIQKQAEDFLTDTHLKFQMLTIGLPGVIYELEEVQAGKSRFRYISQGCQKMFGFSPEEIMQDVNLLYKVIHPADLKDFKKSEVNSRKRVGEWQWEGRIIVDGEERWIEGKSSPSHEKDGTVIRYGLLLDITDKKVVEEQYKLSQERLKLALQGAELGLWEWDANDRKTIFNKGWAAKFGYNDKELELQFSDWGALIHPDDFQRVRKSLIQHLKGEIPFYEAEYRLRTKSGDYRWILDKGRSMERNKKGKVIKASGTYLDINEKKSSELLIQRNDQLFTQLFENSPMGIVLLNDEHRVIQTNQGFKDMFGFSDKDVVGNRLNNILVPKNFKEEALNIDEFATSGEVAMLESRRLHKNGHVIPVIIYGVPVTFNNKPIGIYGIYVDITDRTKAEAELQVRNNELDNFVYKVSHDLRAPLSSILGLVNLANQNASKEDLLQYMGFIENRVKQLDSFINDVLSHSKNLKLAVTVDAIDLKAVVEKCFTDLSYLPNAEKLKKEIKISSEPFYSDKWRVNEVFRNLISNAIKYLNPHIPDPFVQIEIDVTEKAATIMFNDNGIGIAKDTLPHVFQMFYRATEQSEGSGIGLYIVKNAVEKLGGNIEINSNLYVGTSFTITIPNRKKDYHSREGL